MPARRRDVLAATLLAVLALGPAACGTHGSSAPDSEPHAAMLFSPNGEPLSGGPLGHPGCRAAISGWFERVNTNHDGKLTREEYLADARHQFAAMDLNHNGVITPAELSQYRQPYAEGLVLAAQMPAKSGKPGQAPLSAGDQPDPVMAADVRLRNQVTLNDFLAYANRQFTGLDRGHAGHLVKEDLLRFCRS